MKPSRILTSRTAACVLGLSSATAVLQAADVLDDPDQSGWFIRLGGRVSAGVRAQIRDTQVAPLAGVGIYDNGYVKPDVGGSAATTWNWGYNSASQLQGNDVVFQRIDGTPRVGSSSSLRDDPRFGGEIVSGFEFMRFNLWRREVKFGFEAGYSMSTFSSSEHAVATGTAVETIDGYPLNGVVAPIAPYLGTLQGPGPLLSLTPSTHSTISSAATATVDSRLETDFHTLRIGPWFEMPLTGRFSLGFSAGYATVYSSSSWDLTESLAYVDQSLPAATVLKSHSNGAHWSPGVYGQLRLQYRLTQHVGLYAGADWQYSTSVSVIVPGREARFNLGSNYGGVLGVNLMF